MPYCAPWTSRKRCRSAESDSPEDRRIRYRIGIAVGDVLIEEGDVFGDEVNVAARLERLAEPGGICLTDTTYQMVGHRLADGFSDIGSQSVRNISRPIRVWQWSPETRLRIADGDRHARSQRVEFCAAPDGTQLAYADVGTGPTVFKMPNWLNHIEYDWSSPIQGPFLQDLSRRHRLVRFDQRGNGLSDWDVDEISETAMQDDVLSVADAARVGPCALLGLSQGCAIAVRYAATHPEQVRCIVMYGGFARGSLRRGRPDHAAVHSATTQLIRAGWGSTDPAFRHLFTELFIPEASTAQKASMDELQRVACAPENAARISEMNARVDVCAQARALNVPVLVMHAEGDKRVPLDEGRRLAALIPGAEFMTLPGESHMLVPGSPAYGLFLRAFRDFVAAHET